MLLKDKEVFDKLVLKYVITSNVEVAKEILDKFDVVDVINECSVIGIVYHAIKKEPILVKCLRSRERLENILALLYEEYENNIEMLDTIKSLMSGIDLMEEPYFLDYFKKFIDKTIEYYNTQSYEVTATVIDETDIREMVSYLITPLKVLTLSSCLDYLDNTVNDKNCFYIMMELNLLNSREVSSVFLDTIEMIIHVLEIVDRFEDTEEFDFDNYDILEELSYTKEELMEKCIGNIPIDIYDFDKLDFMKFISTLRNMKMDLWSSKFVEKVVIRYIDNIYDDLASIKNKRQDVDEIILDMQYIVELDYRLPRVLYLVSDSFIIMDYLEDPVLATEYKVLKDLEYIEQCYRNYLVDNGIDYTKRLHINWSKMDMLVPTIYYEPNRDDIITSNS